MAAIALGLIGKSIGGSVFGGIFGSAFGSLLGGALGAAAGSVIDNTFLYPSLFKQRSPDIGGPKLDDIRLQTASEGSPVHLCLGPENRIAGTMIWRSPLFEAENRQKVSSGGKKGDSQTVTTSVYSCHIAIGLCEGDIAGVDKIWADSKLIYDATGEEPEVEATFENVTIYHGTQTQEPDPLIQSFQDVEWTPAFRGTAYVVFEYFQIGNFGNRIPQFTFLVRGHSTLSVQSAVQRLLFRAGLDNDFINVSELPTDVFIQGYTISGPQETARALEPIILAYDLLIRERNGKLHFLERTDTDEVEVDEADLAAHELSQEVPRDLALTELPERNLPSEVVVTYADPAIDHQRGSVSERVINSYLPMVEKYDLPLVIDNATARKICHRLLWSKYAEKGNTEVTLPPKYLFAEEGDNLLINSGNEQFTSMMTDFNLGHNFMIQARGVLTQVRSLMSPSLPGQTPDVPPSPGPYTAPDLRVEIINVRALSEDHYYKFGVYYAVAPFTAEEAYRGGKVFYSPGGADFAEVQSLPSRAKLGETLTVLGDTDATVDKWDDTNTVDIELDSGELESLPKGTVENSTLNWILIGEEIIAFSSAELIGPRQYRLSGLIRGLRGTFSHAAQHSVGERVVVLEPGTIGFLPMTFSEVFASKYYRFVPYGKYIGDVSDTDLSSGYNPMIVPAPMAVRNLQRNSDEETGDDLYLEWTRLSRALVRPFTEHLGPELEPSEKYTVEIYSGTDQGGTLRRAVTLTDQTFYHWTEALQMGDGHTPGDPVHVRVVKHSQFDYLNNLGTWNRIGSVASATFNNP